jgi:hypothetical protein
MLYRIQHRIGVAAPASAVWRVLSDLENWPDWNPLYTEAEGRMSIGSLLTFRRAVKGQTRLEQVRIVDWVPNEQLVWSRSIGLFADALGYVEIEALTEQGCIVACGEIYRGLVGKQVGRFSRKTLRPGYVALCEALKTRAEATWDGVPDPALPPPQPKPKPVKPVKQVSVSIMGRRK